MGVPRSRALRGAWNRGYDAALHGEPRSACPYLERPGWRLVFRRAWLAGWEAARDLLRRNLVFPGKPFERGRP